MYLAAIEGVIGMTPAFLEVPAILVLTLLLIGGLALLGYIMASALVDLAHARRPRPR